MSQEEEELNPEYVNHMKTYINNIIPNTSYIIQVSKFCGYSEFLFIFKNSTLLDLYKNVSNQFSCYDIKGLYIRNEKTMAVERIPLTEKITIRYYIVQINNSKDEIKDMMRPVYPLPNKVVFKIYLDDGHCTCNEKHF